jgi:hypothetical protein
MRCGAFCCYHNAYRIACNKNSLQQAIKGRCNHLVIIKTNMNDPKRQVELDLKQHRKNTRETLTQDILIDMLDTFQEIRDNLSGLRDQLASIQDTIENK